MNKTETQDQLCRHNFKSNASIESSNFATKNIIVLTNKQFPHSRETNIAQKTA